MACAEAGVGWTCPTLSRGPSTIACRRADWPRTRRASCVSPSGRLANRTRV